MTEQAQAINPQPTRTKIINRSAGQAVYGLGFIGALIYYIEHAATFGMGLLGVLKAMVWPAMIIYKVLETLKM